GEDLYFVSDRSGWWNLYRLRSGRTEHLAPMLAELGQPLWQFGAHTYAFGSPDPILCTYCEVGVWLLGRLDVSSGRLSEMETPFNVVRDVSVANSKAYFLAGSASAPAAAVSFDLNTSEVEVIKKTSAIELGPGYISLPQAIEFPTEDGLTAHAFYYP